VITQILATAAAVTLYVALVFQMLFLDKTADGSLGSSNGR
jgi:hypothetical protein